MNHALTAERLIYADTEGIWLDLGGVLVALPDDPATGTTPENVAFYRRGLAGALTAGGPMRPADTIPDCIP